MRTAVHPDRPPLLVGAEILLIGDDFLRRRILFFPDPELQRPAIDMGHIVGLALVLEERNAGDVEGFSIAAGSIVHGNASEVTLDVAWNPVGLILVVPA